MLDIEGALAVLDTESALELQDINKQDDFDFQKLYEEIKSSSLADVKETLSNKELFWLSLVALTAAFFLIMVLIMLGFEINSKPIHPCIPLLLFGSFFISIISLICFLQQKGDIIIDEEFKAFAGVTEKLLLLEIVKNTTKSGAPSENLRALCLYIRRTHLAQPNLVIREYQKLIIAKIKSLKSISNEKREIIIKKNKEAKIQFKRGIGNLVLIYWGVAMVAAVGIFSKMPPGNYTNGNSNHTNMSIANMTKIFDSSSNIIGSPFTMIFASVLISILIVH